MNTKQPTVALSVVPSHILRYVIYVCSIVQEPNERLAGTSFFVPWYKSHYKAGGYTGGITHKTANMAQTTPPVPTGENIKLVMHVWQEHYNNLTTQKDKKEMGRGGTKPKPTKKAQTPSEHAILAPPPTDSVVVMPQCAYFFHVIFRKEHAFRKEYASCVKTKKGPKLIGYNRTLLGTNH
jgi:hypothetical protein